MREVAAAEIHGTSAPSVPVASAAKEGSVFTRGFALAIGDAENFGGVDVHDTRVHGDDGFALLVAKSANAETAEATTTTADFGVLILVSELRDAADDDGIHAEEFAELGGGIGIGTVAVGEVLFGQDFVHGFALDDGIRAVLDEMLYQQVGDAFPHVNVRAKGRV